MVVPFYVGMGLNSRAKKILFSAVTEYIATGEPVGSRTIAKKYGFELSAASVRNVLADLEDAGFLMQPHTSAGRIPTEAALRMFIETLATLRELSPQDEDALRARFGEIYASAADPLRETGRALSELSGAAGVVALPRSERRTLTQLRFIPTKPGQLLAVIIFSDGSVENRFIACEAPLSESELTRAHNMLADIVEGRTLGELRELFARRLTDERTAIDAPRRQAYELGTRATDGVSTEPDGLLIEGQSRLMEMPEYGDAARLKNLMRVFEDKEQLVRLLDKTISAGTTSVYLGESDGLAGGEVSVVLSPYTENGRVAGAVGVLGPTRLDYAKVVPLVDGAAAAVSDALSQKK